MRAGLAAPLDFLHKKSWQGHNNGVAAKVKEVGCRIRRTRSIRKQRAQIELQAPGLNGNASMFNGRYPVTKGRLSNRRGGRFTSRHSDWITAAPSLASTRVRSIVATRR